MVIAVVIVVFGAALRVYSDVRMSGVNAGHRLPVTWGRFAVPLPRRVRVARLAGSVLTLWGAVHVVSSVYDYRDSWPAWVVLLSIVVAVLYVPAVSITLVHNRRIAAASDAGGV